MAKSAGLITLLVILGALVGGILTYVIIPAKTVDNPINTQLQVQVTSLQTELNSCKVALLQVPVCAVCNNVTTETDKAGFRTDAVNALYKEKVLDNNDLLNCDGDSYDFDQVTLAKVYDSFSIDMTDKNNYDVSASVRLKYKQSDIKQCYNIVDFKVTWDENEKNPEVEIL
jgi:hypothetical protein